MVVLDHRTTHILKKLCWLRKQQSSSHTSTKVLSESELSVEPALSEDPGQPTRSMGNTQTRLTNTCNVNVFWELNHLKTTKTSWAGDTVSIFARNISSGQNGILMLCCLSAPYEISLLFFPSSPFCLKVDETKIWCVSWTLSPSVHLQMVLGWAFSLGKESASTCTCLVNRSKLQHFHLLSVQSIVSQCFCVHWNWFVITKTKTKKTFLFGLTHGEGQLLYLRLFDPIFWLKYLVDVFIVSSLYSSHSSQNTTVMEF